MHGPAMTGRYDEHWGMVEDGVTWFSASGEAGPPDDQLEGIFQVTAPIAPADAGSGAHDASATTDAAIDEDASVGDADSLEPDDASATPDDALPEGDDADAGEAGRGDVAGDGAHGGGTDPLRGGCSVGEIRGRAESRSFPLVGVVLALAATRIGRRRRRAG
jgi:hypothetical protein